MKPVSIIRGYGPVILGQPHGGTFLPERIRSSLNEEGKLLADTDWHVHKLYEELLDSATIVRANFHRYLIDANRAPCGESLYANQNTTGLIPQVSFDNIPIWTHVPNDEDLKERLTYHTAYHAAIKTELHRLKETFRTVVLYDCHSIRSKIPFLFEDRLPDINIGTNNGTTCGKTLIRSLADLCVQTREYSFVVDGRFRGGWTTRNYGRPWDGIHSVQIELAQCTYLSAEEPPFSYCEEKAATLRPLLKSFLSESEKFALDRA